MQNYCFSFFVPEFALTYYLYLLYAFLLSGLSVKVLGV